MMQMIDLLSTAPAHFLAGIMVTVSSAIYGFMHLSSEISLVRSFWKTLPVLLLAGIAMYFHASPLLSVAMLLCALGDYYLSRGEDRFVPGLLAFLVGHILYIALFSSLSSELNLSWPMMFIALYSGAFGAYMWHATGKHRWPVLAYILVITAMAGVALSLPPPYFLTVLGTFVFVFSDSVLAVRMFIVREQRIKLALSWTVWISYIAGQSLILIGVVGAG